ncbi:hypothetical protein F2P81_023197 [Scophthalmus maximus]|uniref:Annexin n=1 Tax=Scophthalmus maximus TaxID=52904 RepID=A0A6A4RW20_SCOMX|nr:hypothetical protein F2P81_023197 [Scophthalmus maximus]
MSVHLLRCYLSLFIIQEMCWGTLGTVRPFSNFHPDRDVVEIQAALDKKDALTLVRILTNRSNAQRQVIAKTFGETTQKDLAAGVKKALAGDLEVLLLDLLMPSLQYEAHRLQQAMASLLASLNGKKADAGPWINILTSRDSDHLNNVLMGLELESGQMVEEAVEKRFAGDLRLGLKVLVECIQSPDVYLARRLTTLKTSIVQGIMVSHSEEDLLCIRVAYLKLTGTSLYTALQKEFKGDHLQALLAICRSED